jgi:hypothetical protein
VFVNKVDDDYNAVHGCGVARQFTWSSQGKSFDYAPIVMKSTVASTSRPEEVDDDEACNVSWRLQGGVALPLNQNVPPPSVDDVLASSGARVTTPTTTTTTESLLQCMAEIVLIGTFDPKDVVPYAMAALCPTTNALPAL